MAWDRYTVVAIALGQMSHLEAQEHKSVVEEVRVWHVMCIGRAAL